jgi:hypothetical protein
MERLYSRRLYGIFHATMDTISRHIIRLRGGGKASRFLQPLKYSQYLEIESSKILPFSGSSLIWEL